MHRPVAGGSIADAGGHVIVLCARLRHDFDRRADPVAVALCSLKLNLQPVSRPLSSIHPDFGLASQCCYHDINSAVAIEVTEGAPAVPCGRRGVQPCLLGQGLPSPAGAQIPKDGVVLLDLCAGFRQRLDVPARHEQVLPAVVVEYRAGP